MSYFLSTYLGGFEAACADKGMSEDAFIAQDTISGVLTVVQELGSAVLL